MKICHMKSIDASIGINPIIVSSYRSDKRYRCRKNDAEELWYYLRINVFSLFRDEV